MRSSLKAIGLVLLAASAGAAGAETIELVTYYPSVVSGDIESDRIHASRATIGDDPYSLTNPPDADLPDGTLLVAGDLGIGTDSPTHQLDVSGPWTPGPGGSQVRIHSDNTSAAGVALTSEGGTREWIVYRTPVTDGERFAIGINGVNEPFVLLPNGNVGIGMNNPARRLDVAGNNNGISVGSAGPGGARVTLNDYGNAGDVQLGYNRTPTDGQENPALYSWAFIFGNALHDQVQFARKPPGGTWDYFMTIANTGGVGIGTTTPHSAFRFHAHGGGSDPRHVALFSSDSGTNAAFLGVANNASNWYLTAYSNGSFAVHQPSVADRLNILSNGNVGIGTTGPGYKLDVAGQAHATGFPTSSDARLKANVVPLNGVLEKLDKVRPVAFDWNGKYEQLGRSSGHREIGVVAQDVEAVFPELVTTWGEENYRAVDYGRFTAVLVQAVKELKARDEQRTQQLSDLTKQNRQLQEQVKALLKQAQGRPE